MTHLSAPAHDNILLMRMTWKGCSRMRMWKPSLPQVFTMYLLAQIRAASRAVERRTTPLQHVFSIAAATSGASGPNGAQRTKGPMLRLCSRSLDGARTFSTLGSFSSSRSLWSKRTQERFCSSIRSSQPAALRAQGCRRHGPPDSSSSRTEDVWRHPLTFGRQLLVFIRDHVTTQGELVHFGLLPAQVKDPDFRILKKKTRGTT